jgi:hypothetical protein
MALWPIFCFARSYLRISVCSSLGALKIDQSADGGMSPTYGAMSLEVSFRGQISGGLT